MVDLDLGEKAGPAILYLPRTGGRGIGGADDGQPGADSREGATDDARESPGLPLEPVADTGDGDDEPRYQFETVLGKTAESTLSRAVDTSLDRSVILERYRDAGGEASERERRLYALARGGGPFLQRALAYDRASAVAVFEAPSGTPIGEGFAASPPSPRQAVRLLKRLARAVAPLHEHGLAHGAIDETTALVDDDGNPTVLICGLGPAQSSGQKPADDVSAIIALVAGLISAEPSPAGLARALIGQIEMGQQTALEAISPPATGEELYAFADAVEVSLLEAWRARGAMSP